MDQLVVNNTLLTWEQLQIKNTFSKKGRIPSWWKLIEEEVLIPGTRSIKKLYELNTNNTFLTSNHSLNMTSKIDKRKNNWIITKRNHHKYTKRVIVSLLNNNTWNIDNSEIEIQYYKNVKQENWNLIVEKCTDTNCLFGKWINGDCIITVNKVTTLLLDKKPIKKGNQWLIKQPYFSLLIDLENLER